jgi:hypothetical protein
MSNERIAMVLVGALLAGIVFQFVAPRLEVF